MRLRYVIPIAAAVALALVGSAFPPAGSSQLERCDQEDRTGLASRPDVVESTTAENVLAMEWHRGRPYLARLDTRTLETRDLSRVRVSTVATISPDGTGVVTGLGGDYVPIGGGMRLRFVDVATMKIEAEVPIGRGGGVHSVHWFDDRVIAVVGNPVRVLIVDPASFKLVEEIALGVDQVFEVRGAEESVVILAAAEPGSTHPSQSEIAPTRMHVVTTAGELRSSVTLDADAGYEFDRELGGRHHYPGLAIDAGGDRAFVADGPRRVVEVNLSSMDVAYRSIGSPPSLWARLLSLFGGIAEAKLSTGLSIEAHALSNGSLLVEGESEGRRRTPLEMTLIDTESWDACHLNTNFNAARVGEDVIVAWDSILHLGRGRTDRRDTSGGVAVYDVDGRKRFQTLKGTPVCWMDLLGTTAYAYKCGEGVAAIDLTTGKVRHLRPGRPIEMIRQDMTF